MCECNEKPQPRRRSLTSLTLNWLADKVKRSEEIKQKLAEGTYSVDSRKIAAVIANKEE